MYSFFLSTSPAKINVDNQVDLSGEGRGKRRTKQKSQLVQFPEFYAP